MTQQDTRADAVEQDEAMSELPDITSDVVAEELGEAFIESATAGKDQQERRDSEGLDNLEPEETAISTIVDEVLLAARNEPD